MKKLFLMLFIPVLLTGTAQAHYLWVERVHDGYVINRGLFPDQLHSYEAGNVKEIKAFDKQGKLLGMQRQDGADKAGFLPAAPPALVTVLAEWGYRVNTPTGKEFLTKQQAQEKGLQVEDAFFSTHFAKTIFDFSDKFTKPVGQHFEIVPLHNPLTLAPGQELPVKILFAGAPLPDCRVKAENVKDLLQTDKNGVVRITVSAEGLQMIYASHRTPTPDRKDMDYVFYMTFLKLPRP